MPGDLSQVQPFLPLEQRLDRVRRGVVQPPLVVGAELGGDRLADQGVRETVIARPVAGYQEPGCGALVQRGQEVQDWHVQHLGHDAGGERVACYGGGAEQFCCALGHLGEPVGRRLEHPVWNSGRPGGAVLGEHVRHFADQERVAAGFLVHAGGLVRIFGQPSCPEQLRDGCGGQAIQGYPLGVRVGGQPQQGAAGRAGLSGRVPAGREQQDAGTAELAHDVGQQHLRSLVGPLEIVEHEEQPGMVGSLGQPPADLGEQREPLGIAGITVGVAGGTRPYVCVAVGAGADGWLGQGQPPQAVRRGAVPVGGPRPRGWHVPAGGRRGEFLGQAGLADTGLAGARHQAPAARQRLIEQQRDLLQFAVTPDHQPGRAARHSPHRATITASECRWAGLKRPGQDRRVG